MPVGWKTHGEIVWYSLMWNVYNFLAPLLYSFFCSIAQFCALFVIYIFCGFTTLSFLHCVVGLMMLQSKIRIWDLEEMGGYIHFVLLRLLRLNSSKTISSTIVNYLRTFDQVFFRNEPKCYLTCFKTERSSCLKNESYCSLTSFNHDYSVSHYMSMF